MTSDPIDQRPLNVVVYHIHFLDEELRARMYLGEFLAWLGLELCAIICLVVKSNTTDHQCLVPLGFNGIIS